MSDNDVAEIKKRLEEHEKRISKLENLFQARPEAVKKGLSIREFLLSKNAKGGNQTTLAIGFYLENYEGMSSFNVPDLQRGFDSAKEPAPKNLNRSVIANIEQGYVLEAGKKDNLKARTLTNTGEQFVENNFKEAK